LLEAPHRQIEHWLCQQVHGQHYQPHTDGCLATGWRHAALTAARYQQLLSCDIKLHSTCHSTIWASLIPASSASCTDHNPSPSGFSAFAEAYCQAARHRQYTCSNKPRFLKNVSTAGREPSRSALWVPGRGVLPGRPPIGMAATGLSPRLIKLAHLAAVVAFCPLWHRDAFRPLWHRGAHNCGGVEGDEEQQVTSCSSSSTRCSAASNPHLSHSDASRVQAVTAELTAAARVPCPDIQPDRVGSH
jgi:hypothetical protein